MKKYLLILILLFVFPFSTLKAEKNEYFYLSPGFTLSFDLKGNFLFSPKLSFGIFRDSEFLNITIGHVSTISEKKYSYFYLEPQYGALTGTLEFKKVQLFYGAGLGIAYFPDRDNNKVALKGSLFGGFGLFLNASFVFSEENYTDIGLQAVLPISLKKDYFNFKM